MINSTVVCLDEHWETVQIVQTSCKAKKKKKKILENSEVHRSLTQYIYRGALGKL